MREAEEECPLPDDFCNYLPWACHLLGVPVPVVVNRISQNEIVSAITERKKNKSRTKITQSTFNILSEQDLGSIRRTDQSTNKQNINVTAVYNNSNNLVEIRFEKNRNTPRIILKVIKLIVQFYYQLNRIHLIGGVDKYTVHEVSEIIKVSHITEICLDYCFVEEGNYSILLQRGNSLRYLSLSKCKINDAVVEKLCTTLIHPEQGSESLIVLNLSTNMITDTGANFIAEVLRSNRKLSYLILTDNSITDDGAKNILDTLLEFPLRDDELQSARLRQGTYLKDKMNLIKITIDNLLSGDLNRKSRRKTGTMSTASLKKRKALKSPNLKSRDDSKLTLQTAEDFFDTAVKMVEETLGEFDDPFMSKHNVVRDDVVYCKGNDTLAYINFSYNNLTFSILKKIGDVLTYQKLFDRKRPGLLNVVLEGNYLPASCIEMKQMDELIEAGSIAVNRKTSVSKKKPPTKASARSNV